MINSLNRLLRIISTFSSLATVERDEYEQTASVMEAELMCFATTKATL